jgi:competence protein ComEC
LVVTHFHADHVGGIDGVLRNRSVGEIVETGYPEPESGQHEVSRAAVTHRIPVRVATAGEVFAFAGLRLVVLGPVRQLAGTRSDPNNNSVVVLAELRGRRVLLAGDAEEDEQQEVLDAIGTAGLRADVLKVAHHGSAYQQPGFLDAVAPAAALVSVGAGNPYGHPNAAVLSRLARNGARVLRTDIDGDLAAVLTPHGLAVAVGGGPRRRAPPGRH